MQQIDLFVIASAFILSPLL